MVFKLVQNCTTRSLEKSRNVTGLIIIINFGVVVLTENIVVHNGKQNSI